MAELSQQHCLSADEGLSALEHDALADYLAQVPEWRPGEDSRSIEREFRFRDFYQTIAFVNAVAWIANREDHHPDLQVGYNRCHIRYTTHAVDGLSLNDFICAARIDQLNR